MAEKTIKSAKHASKLPAKEKSTKISRDDIEDYLSKDFIYCRSVIEMAGAPKEYIEETIRRYIEKLKENMSIKLVQVDFSEATEEKGLFSVFAELEFLAKNPESIVYYCFDYMPVSIEIMEPNTFQYKAAEFAGFFNDFLARLHKIDLLVKDLTAKNKSLLKNTNLILRNMIILTLEYNGSLGIEDLSKRIGVAGSHLNNFIEQMVSDGWLKKEKKKEGEKEEELYSSTGRNDIFKVTEKKKKQK